MSKELELVDQQKENLLGDDASAVDIPLPDPILTTQQVDFRNMVQLLICFVGLQVSYLTWGIMQEKIMTTQYEPTPLVPDGKFPSATFCVFSNRFLAIILAAVLCMTRHGTLKTASPLWFYSPCALSNTLSSWGQYKALQYVSFPLQVLFKSAKVIPVMVMGKVLNKQVYVWAEYGEAMAITVGVAMFSLASSGSSDDKTSSMYGFLMLLLYICSDSFTAQWQDKIYKKYPNNQIDQYQMMFGVNCSAIIITISMLIIGNDMPAVIQFLIQNPNSLVYNIITAVTSASGQMFIFYTIKSFGPVVFTIIMTTRQMISMVISTILFGHQLAAASFAGALVVFGAVFYRIRRKTLEKRNKQTNAQQKI
uniref:Sugar phosphate transporter domain-containing protein n=1 Tax=Octactis speculum TaxID=3111310 RepID=A0A7S2MHM3_9STRA|mmetsp:Transcript_62440/g.85823  ORF Transcript_62440/g.85823 Transcript_62440/m.85823 type:complete len:365 (+) Transcript_62440:14-1108(+)